jgi:hypothetical protein
MPAEKEGLRKVYEGIVICTNPDVCKTPPTNDPVPYQIVGHTDPLIAPEERVRMTGLPSYTLKTRIPTVIGDEPGVGGGVVSGVNKSFCEAISYSTTVRAGGQNIVRDKDRFKMNRGNTVGIAVYDKGGTSGASKIASDGSITGNSNPPLTPETPAEAVYWLLHQLGGIFRGAAEAAWDMVKGIGTLLKGAWDATGQLGFNYDPGATQAARNGFLNAITTIRNNPSSIINALIQDYRDEIARGEYGEALGRVGVDIGSLFLGGAGLAGKGGETANLVRRLGALAGKLGEVVDRTGQLGSDANKLGRLMGKVTEEVDLAAVGQDGVKVVGKKESLRVTFGHGARHLAGTGLSQAEVENAIVQSLNAASNTGAHWGWVQVEGQWIQYRVFILSDGQIAIRTYVVVPGNLSNLRMP